MRIPDYLSDEDFLMSAVFRMHSQVSLFKYTWTVRGGHIFNNAYYKNIVRDTDWFIESEVTRQTLLQSESLLLNVRMETPAR